MTIAPPEPTEPLPGTDPKERPDLPDPAFPEVLPGADPDTSPDPDPETQPDRVE